MVVHVAHGRSMPLNDCAFCASISAIGLLLHALCGDQLGSSDVISLAVHGAPTTRNTLSHSIQLDGSHTLPVTFGTELDCLPFESCIEGITWRMEKWLLLMLQMSWCCVQRACLLEKFYLFSNETLWHWLRQDGGACSPWQEHAIEWLCFLCIH